MISGLCYSLSSLSRIRFSVFGIEALWEIPVCPIKKRPTFWDIPVCPKTGAIHGPTGMSHK